MAFKPVESTKTQTPFFNVWKKSIPDNFVNFLNGKFMTPKTIKETQSNKGFMLNFDDEFTIFIWRSGSIGKMIAECLQNEEGNLLMIVFKISRKGNLDYDIGFDDESEVAIIPDKFDEGIFYQEVTNEKNPPIAPDDYRDFLSHLPRMTPRTPPVLAPSKTKPKVTKRSDGEG